MPTAHTAHTDQSGRGVDLPLTRSLGWWLCVTAKQTVMQMSVRAGPIFIWSSSTEAPLKAKELWGQGFKAISFPRHIGHYLAPCVTLYLRKWGWLLGSSGYIYVGLYKCVLISRGEWVVTVKNFHQKPCHFTGTATRSTFVSCVDTLPQLVMSVGYQKTASSNLFGGIRQISLWFNATQPAASGCW